LAVDVREPDVRAVDKLGAAYQAKARAELADADAIVGAAPGAWDGPLVGARIAFLVAHRAAPAPAAILASRTADAVTGAAEALGSADAAFILVTRPILETPAHDRARRVRVALEAVDAPAVIALDSEAAEDLAVAFGLDALRPGAPVHALGRSLGSVGDFAASLDDAAAKARAWSAMKAVAAPAGLKAKGRPKAPPAEPGPGPKAAGRD
jgi:hypothetical protein